MTATGKAINFQDSVIKNKWAILSGIGGKRSRVTNTVNHNNDVRRVRIYYCAVLLWQHLANYVIVGSDVTVSAYKESGSALINVRTNHHNDSWLDLCD